MVTDVDSVDLLKSRLNIFWTCPDMRLYAVAVNNVVLVLEQKCDIPQRIVGGVLIALSKVVSS